MKENHEMQLNDLSPAAGSTKKRKRVGRGNGSGHGSTAGRGDKGQNSRSGGGKGPGFEGGQNPLHMRLPKLPGFKNRFRVESEIVNVGRLEELFSKGDVVNVDALFAKGVIKSKTQPVKVLGDGELTKKLTVKVDKVSGPARTKIEAAGGTVEVL
jgi:large subunit ribosomal protein L15